MDSAITSWVASFRSTNSVEVFFLEKSARNRMITSDARLPSRIVRRAVWRGPATLGGAVDVGRVRGEHPQTGAGIGDDTGQRLVDLVGDRCGQGSKAGDSCHVGE